MNHIQRSALCLCLVSSIVCTSDNGSQRVSTENTGIANRFIQFVWDKTGSAQDDSVNDSGNQNVSSEDATYSEWLSARWNDFKKAILDEEEEPEPEPQPEPMSIYNPMYAYTYVTENPYHVTFAALGATSFGYMVYHVYTYWLTQMNHEPSKYERAALYAAAVGFVSSSYYLVTSYNDVRPIQSAYNWSSSQVASVCASLTSSSE